MNSSTMLRVGLCLMVLLAVLTTRAATSTTTSDTTSVSTSGPSVAPGGGKSSTVSPKKNLATSVNGSNVIMTFACFVAMVYRLF